MSVSDSSSPFLALPDEMVIDSIQPTATSLVVNVSCWHLEAFCPLCSSPSERVHGHYTRTVADLPCGGRRVTFSLTVRKFVCSTTICPRKIFTERLPTLVQSYARMTNRLISTLQELGFATCGEVGERLAPKLGMYVSGPTLLRRMRALPCPVPEPVRIVGIDDWAWKKGRTYGTILCDLERHLPIDLLPDREADTVAAWLLEHPTVEIVSRDRAGAYADAARRGAPHALQVADRFHILKNLGDALEPVLDRNQACLRDLSATEPLAQREEQVTSPLSHALDEIRPVPVNKAEHARLAHRVEHQQRYERIIALRKQGFTIAAIAHRVEVGHSTVERSLAASSFSERQRRSKERTKLDTYHSYLCEHWQMGVHNAAHLFRDLVALGYTGCYASVYKYVRCLQTGICLPTTPLQPVVRTLSVKQARFLFLRVPTNGASEDQHDVETILDRSTELTDLYRLSQDFVTMLRERRASDLDDWLQQAERSHISDLQRFANGIRRDYAAVKAAFSCEISNGQVEGQVLRLKLQKRQVYGRAKFDLLRQRVLHHV
ncbi:MAG: ISL3 family transposase [Ktedonobacteraceae bacterium]